MENIENLYNKAKEGDVNSQLLLARIKYKEKKYEDALFWYKSAMEQGHADGINGVGLCYLHGFGVEQDKEKGEYYLRLAVDHGSTKAMYNLAGYINSQESGTLYLRAANLGDPDAQLKMARYFLEPQLNSSWKITGTRDTEEAFHWFWKSALQGHRIAQYEIGLFFEKGIDPCVRNIQKAFAWFKKAAAQGLNMAIFSIGRLYANGIDDSNPDFSSAYRYFQMAADAGLREAQYRTGLALFYGRGVEEDKYKAYQYLLMAAEQGHSDAQFYIALLLTTGQGVEKNIELAKEWLTTKRISLDIVHKYEEKVYSLLDYLIKDADEVKITECTPIDLAFAHVDSFGVLYSQDGRKLLRYAIEDDYFLPYFNIIKQQTLIDYEVPEGVEIICDEAFEECESLEKIKLPDSIQHIGERAFSGCENLMSVNLSEGLTALQDQVFYGCTSLHDICIPSTVITIEEDALVGVRHLTSNSNRFIIIEECLIDSYNDTIIHFFNHNKLYFEIPKSIRKIGSYAFSGCTLTGVYIPDTIEEIGWCAFENSFYLEDVDFCYHSANPKLRKIKAMAFGNCESLIQLVLPEGLKVIENQAFSLCRNLRIVILPDSLQEIGSLAFERTGLQSITLPVNLKKLGDIVFGASNLRALQSKSTVFKVKELSIYNAEETKLLQYYGKEATYRLPDFVLEIGDFAFGYSDTLRSLEIPSSVRVIGKRILEQSYPKSIMIPGVLLSKMKDAIDESMFDRIKISDDL